jgi:transposase
VIELKSGTRIWIAAGFTDLRRGFQGLSSIVETVLEQAPFSGHVFVFRGKRGDLIKLLARDSWSKRFVVRRDCHFRKQRSRNIGSRFIRVRSRGRYV